MNRVANWMGILLACCGLTWSLEAARADTFPDMPVHFIVSLSPGGGVDTLSRIIAQKLSEKWGQQVVVENLAGGGGVIAASDVAHAKPDGYTILWTGNQFTSTPSMVKLSYDPIHDFTPLMQVVTTPDVLTVRSDSPVKSVRDLIALAKSAPGTLNFGSPGIGTAPFLEMEAFTKQTGITMVHVAYKGGGDVVVALLGGEVQYYFATLATINEYIASGKLRPLAVAAKDRSSFLPDVPTVAEAAGLPQFDAADADWTGALLPAGTPATVTNQLNSDIAAVMKEPDVQKRLAALGFVPVASSPDQFAAIIKAEYVKWGALLKGFQAQ